MQFPIWVSNLGVFKNQTGAEPLHGRTHLASQPNHNTTFCYSPHGILHDILRTKGLRAQTFSNFWRPCFGPAKRSRKRHRIGGPSSELYGQSLRNTTRWAIHAPNATAQIFYFDAHRRHPTPALSTPSSLLSHALPSENDRTYLPQLLEQLPAAKKLAHGAQQLPPGASGPPYGPNYRNQSASYCCPTLLLATRAHVALRPGCHESLPCVASTGLL